TRGWRAVPGTWAAANVTPLLKSAKGDAHLSEIVAELARRLGRTLAWLDEGPAVLDDRDFVSAFQYSLSWLAYQGDITARSSALRAYCDITATLAVFDLLANEIAKEFGIGDVAATLADAAGSWREPLIIAGRRALAAGDYDEAIKYARRALNIVSACPESQRLMIDALRSRQTAGSVIDPMAQAGLADLRGRFCPRPFEVLVSTQSTGWNAATNTTEQIMGASYLCDCAAWLPFIAGNVVEADSPDDVWNSSGAEEIRRSILDGDYSYCSRTLCPMIANGNLPRTGEVTEPRLRRIIDQHQTILDDGPRLIALGHDSSCNLACPSCRVGIVMADKAQNERLDRARDTVILPLLRGREVGLHLTAWGDPFASKHYRSILEALRDEDFNGVQLSILTNGLALTKSVWETMPHLREKIVELRVSVDAATKETYEDVRRPGRWEVIYENLRVMGEISSAGTFLRNRANRNTIPGTDDAISFSLAFVVQSANFREMPAFVKLAEEVNADSVIFQRYYSFGHEESDVFSAKDVAAVAHPEHPALQVILANPIMRSPRVNQTFIAQLAGESPS
ncbi:MAG: radical SAM protein, partial [Acidobacteria bacterium]|nr:radical SAM protein [Acidobacteriota bacterium]